MYVIYIYIYILFSAMFYAYVYIYTYTHAYIHIYIVAILCHFNFVEHLSMYSFVPCIGGGSMFITWNNHSSV